MYEIYSIKFESGCREMKVGKGVNDLSNDEI